MYNSISNMYQSFIQVFTTAEISGRDFRTPKILGCKILGRPQVGESDIHLSYDDEIKINVEILTKRALDLKTLQRLSKEKDIYKQHANN